MALPPAPKLVIRVHDGLTVLTRVTLNGEDVQCLRVSFDSGEKGWDTDGLVKVRLEFIADIDFEMDWETPGLELRPRRHLRLPA